ncbi:MAG: beta-ketoacyl-ACP synthase III [Eubacteriaceae bacterium]|jgi:3-oxoacyl-[acyl-carrier-protein] synthase-3
MIKSYHAEASAQGAPEQLETQELNLETGNHGSVLYPSVIGTGHARPSRTVENAELSQYMETDDAWIRSRTGIERRNVSEDEDVSELSVRAARMAIADAGINKEEIGLIVCATISADCNTPSAACLIQEALGLNGLPVMAFDVNAACSGFMFALRTADSLMQTGDFGYALVIGAENLTKYVDWSDRNTAIIFADGAGAVILDSCADQPMLHYSRTKGDTDGVIRCKARKPQKFGHTDIDGYDEPGYIRMKGREVFRFAVAAMQEAVEALLDQSDFSLEDIDWIIPHQANKRIIDHVARKMKIPEDKVVVNIQNWGNTSAASIPIALSELRQQGKLEPGMKIILTGFGAGFTWGGALVEYKGNRNPAADAVVNKGL